MKVTTYSNLMNRYMKKKVRGKVQEEESIEAWSNKPEHQLQEKWTTEHVVEGFIIQFM